MLQFILSLRKQWSYLFDLAVIVSFIPTFLIDYSFAIFKLLPPLQHVFCTLGKLHPQGETSGLNAVYQRDPLPVEEQLCMLKELFPTQTLHRVFERVWYCLEHCSYPRAHIAAARPRKNWTAPYPSSPLRSSLSSTLLSSKKKGKSSSSSSSSSSVLQPL